MEWLTRQLESLAEQGLKRERRALLPLADGWVEWHGRRYLNFASNDYLNLASHPRVIAAANEPLQTSVGARASALVTGRSVWHERLEEKLAAFEGTEAALLFPTGYAANVGTIAALVDSPDTVFCDRWNHASLIDGCRLSGARLRVYRHDDLEGLRRELRKSPTTGRKWIITDSVFSMDGDVAPLAELCDLAAEFDAELIVDEAHGTGVFGATGRGVAELTGTEHRIAVRIGTLSKSLGALGGFVTGSQPLIEWLWNRARSQVFSTALPPSICAAAMTAVEILLTEPQRCRQLLDRCDFFRHELQSRGVQPMQGSVGPIIPIVIGDPTATMAIAQRVEAAGYLVGAIRPPTVPNGTSRLRISVTSAFSELDLSNLATAIACAISGSNNNASS